MSDGRHVGPYTANSTGHGRSHPKYRSRGEESIRQYLGERGILRIFCTRWDLYRLNFTSLGEWIERVMTDYENHELRYPPISLTASTSATAGPFTAVASSAIAGPSSMPVASAANAPPEVIRTHPGTNTRTAGMGTQAEKARHIDRTPLRRGISFRQDGSHLDDPLRVKAP